MIGEAGCAFCDIVAGRAPSLTVYASEDCVAFFPDSPAVLGHTLVVPRAHVPDFLAATTDQSAAVAEATGAVGRALAAELRPDGMNTVTSAGAAATQTVFHWHVHVLPRWHDDAIGDLWPSDQHFPADKLDELAGTLRSALS